MEVLEKNKTTTGSNIPTSGYLSRENEKTNLKKYMHPHVHCSVMYNGQEIDTTYVSFNELIDTENVKEIDIKSNIIQPHKKE